MINNGTEIATRDLYRWSPK